MNKIETYIANEIRLRVWSGLTDARRVQNIVTDLIEGDADEATLRALVATEFDRKEEAEKSWLAETDCDKLIRVFNILREKGVISIHNAGWDKSEAFQNCLEEYRAYSNSEAIFGICYYTSQDVDGAIDGHGLYIGYSSSRAETEESDALRTAQLICDELNNAGLKANWGGDAKSRIKLEINWQWRRKRREIS